MKKFGTIADVIHRLEAVPSVPDAFCYQTIKGEWEKTSTLEFLDQVRSISLALRNLGIKRGDCVGILADSSPRWTAVDLAIIIAGGVTVPLFGNISNENFEFEVEQTGMRVLFVAGRQQWEMYNTHQKLFDSVINLYDEECAHRAFLFSELLEQGKALHAKEPALYNSLLDALSPEDMASIVYTSGSTGFPKGVMLSHQNLVGLIHIDPFKWDLANDLYLSVLPLAHIFARAVNYIMVAWGIRTYYIREIATVGEASRRLKPTILVVVPRLLEKVYGKMAEKVRNSSPLKKLIGLWAFELANRKGENWVTKIMRPIADKLVYAKLREALGGRLRLAISGGAPLNPHLYNFFLNVGIPVREGWGLTEASAVCCNRLEKNKIGTVGPPFENMELRIEDNGEVLVHGPIVMMGYYKHPEVTKETLTSDGWLRTGDRGSLDEDNFLTIEGRIKELYKSSTGEYIAPVPIEQQLCKAPLIDMAMVVADNRKFASCLLFPDFEILHSIKSIYGKEGMSDEAFLKSSIIKSEVRKLLAEINLHLNHWEELHAYQFVMTPPTIEGGELTPTLKMRRDVIEEKYKELIDMMYSKE